MNLEEGVVKETERSEGWRWMESGKETSQPILFTHPPSSCLLSPSTSDRWVRCRKAWEEESVRMGVKRWGMGSCLFSPFPSSSPPISFLLAFSLGFAGFGTCFVKNWAKQNWGNKARAAHPTTRNV